MGDVGDFTVLRTCPNFRPISSKHGTSLDGDGERQDIGKPESADSDDKDDVCLSKFGSDIPESESMATIEPP